jgi:rod shape determining protein RodA
MSLATMQEFRVSFRDRVACFDWVLVLLLSLISSFGFVLLYSAANGSFDPWAGRQMIRFGIGLGLMAVVALVDLRYLMTLAYPTYGLALGLLVYVDIAGEIGMGAQRWIDLGAFQLQPSEMMKLALVMALARYFHRLPFEAIGRPPRLVIPIVLVLAPTGLVLVQPDLGTAGTLLLVSAAIFFLAGVRWWKFALAAAAAAAAVPLGWQFLHDYQKNRLLTFINPEADPLGAGYHIMQSKIAFGSGGLFGKGFLAGTQSHLNFLPERQTDFIFTMLAEEFGLVGCGTLLLLYGLLFAYGFALAWRCRNQFGRLLVLGLTANLSVYVFINAAMTMGLIPVVGVPLPLVSYGGTAMLTILIGYGLVAAVQVNERVRGGRVGAGEEG